MCFSIPAPARGAVTVGYFFSGGFDSLGGSSTTVGFPFYVNEDIAITHLGLIDVGSDGLSAGRDVGLWNNSGTLLKSTTVPAGTAPTLLGQFRYVPITPIPLTAGEVYWLGGRMVDDPYVGGTSITTVPQITAVDAGYTHFANGGGLTFPRSNLPNTGSVAVANFQFVVPEPASLALLGLGGLGLLSRRRK